MTNKQSVFWPVLRGYLSFTILLGLLYPLFITFVGHAAFPRQAGGSLVQRNGIAIGSTLIAQKFEGTSYFWTRPSAVDFNPLPSGGSNLGPTSQALKEAVEARKAKLGIGAPQGLLFASGSGLDPQIDVESALFQVSRVAQARHVPEEDIRSMVLAQIESRELGFLGEDRVNVLRLNLALDERK